MSGDSDVIPALPAGTPTGHSYRGTARDAIRGATWLSGERWISQALSALVFIALGRLVAPAAFGLIAAANVLVLLFRVLVDGGFSRALIQLPSIDDEDVDTAFWTSMVLGAALASIAVTVSPLVADVFGEHELQRVVVVLSPVFILVALDSSQSALLDRAMNFRVQATRRILATVVSSGAALSVAAAGGGVWALVVQTLTYESLLVVLLWTLTTWRPSRRWSRSRAGRLLRLGASLTGVRLMQYVTTNADNFLIGVVLGPVALGLYAVAYRVLLVLYEMTGLTLYRVSVPVFSRCQQDSRRLQRAFLDASELGLLVSLPLFVGLAVMGDRAVPMLFGSRWHAAGSIAQALALAGIVYVPTGLLQNVVTTANRVAAELQWTVVSTLLLVAAFAASVHFGVVAVAWSLGLTVALLFPFRLRWAVREHLLLSGTGRQFSALTLRLAGPATCVAAVMLVVKDRTGDWSDLAAVVSSAAMGLATYLLAIRVLSPRTWQLATRSLRHLRAR